MKRKAYICNFNNFNFSQITHIHTKTQVLEKSNLHFLCFSHLEQSSKRCWRILSKDSQSLQVLKFNLIFYTYCHWSIPRNNDNFSKYTFKLNFTCSITELLFILHCPLTCKLHRTRVKFKNRNNYFWNFWIYLLVFV